MYVIPMWYMRVMCGACNINISACYTHVMGVDLGIPGPWQRNFVDARLESHNSWTPQTFTSELSESHMI